MSVACALACVVCALASATVVHGAWQTLVTTSTPGSTSSSAPRAYASAVALDNSGTILLTGGMYVASYTSPQPTTLYKSNGVLPVPDASVGLYSDAMRSQDGGRTWQQVNSVYTNSGFVYPSSTFSPRALHASVAYSTSSGAGDTTGFNDRVLIYGGVTYGTRTSQADTLLADVWQISSGCNVWTRITASATPGPRAGHALVSLPAKNIPGVLSLSQRFLLIGGADSLTRARADVWLSSDGANSWYRAYDGTATFGPRVGHSVAVISDIPYLMGGFDTYRNPRADVWRATDSGAGTWQLVTSPAGWTGVGFALSATGGLDTCVMTGSDGKWQRAYDITLFGGGHTGAMTGNSVTGLITAANIAVTTPDEVDTPPYPLSAGQWTLNVPAAMMDNGVTGAAVVYDGTGFVAIGGVVDVPQNGRSYSWSSAVRRLSKADLMSLLPTDVNGTVPVSSACPAGYYGGCGNTCTPCPAGQFSVAGSVHCTQCLPGTASSMTGATSCTACAYNMYSANSGSQYCSQCQWGATANAARTGCNAPSAATQPRSSSGHKLTGGQIAGIVIGSVFAAALLCAAVCCCVRRKRAAAAGANGAASVASAGSAAGLGMLSTDSAPAQHVVVVNAGALNAAAAKTFAASPGAVPGNGVAVAYPVVPAPAAQYAYVPLQSPFPSAPQQVQPPVVQVMQPLPQAEGLAAGRVVVIRPNGPGGTADATASWQTLF